MAIEVTQVSVSQNVKVYPAAPACKACGIDLGTTTYQNMVQAYNVDLSKPKDKALVVYQMMVKQEGDKVGWTYLGGIETTNEWLIALIQDVINIDLKNSNLPLIPITGEFDCETQKAMVMEAGGARGVNPSALPGSPKVYDIGPEEFIYTLSRSPVLVNAISTANFSTDPNTGLLPNGLQPLDKTIITGDLVVTAPAGKEPEPLKFVGLKADSAKCAGTGTDGKDVVPVTDKDKTPAKEETSYFWPVVGGLVVGGAVIGLGYVAFKDKSKKTSSPAY